MAKIGIIGGGVAGCMAALQINDKNEIIIFEGTNNILKKLLLTGNGKCNFWNESISVDNYYTDNLRILNKVLNNKDKTYKYLINDLNFYPKIKNNYYYPNSQSAASIKKIFENKLNQKNVKILYDFKVKDIKLINDKFNIIAKDDEVLVDKLIIATGGKTYPKTGSDGSIFNILNNLGIKINPINPSLVPLKLNLPYLKEWDGLRVDAKIKLLIDGYVAKEETGEIQLTDYGVSGICVFNISSLVTSYLNLNKTKELIIDFLPDEKNLAKYFKSKNDTLENVLESIFNYKLGNIFLNSCKYDKDTNIKDLNDDQINKLVKTIKEFKVTITSSLDFDRAQVSNGGVSLNEVNENLELNNIKNMYIIGETLDVDGICGGYNLCFALTSGYLAGRNINHD